MVSSDRRRPLRLAVLLSGGGRTLENLAQVIGRGELPAQVVRVIASHPEAGGLGRAERLRLPHVAVDFREYRDNPGGFSAAVTREVDAADPDLVLLAGFLRRWDFPSRYDRRVLNIHPALLPAFGGKGYYGDRVHRAVLEAGVKFSGCTVHYADGEYDTGPIIVQRIVPVRDDDTVESLASRVFEEERIAYPEAIRHVAEGRLAIRDGRVVLSETGEGTSTPR